MRKTVLAMLIALVSMCSSAVAEDAAEDWMKKVDEPLVKEMWNRTYGGPGNELASEVQVTKDGGYVIIGVTESYGAGDGDAWLIKTDSEGNEEWNKTFGGPEYDSGKSVRETRDGGYIIAGRTESYGAGDSDVWLIKTDLEGNEIWNKTFGGREDDSGSSVQETSDGGYIISASTESYGAGDYDVWVIKTDSDGSEEWNKTFGGPGADWSNSVLNTEDDGYIVTGYTESYGTGGKDIWLIKTDSEGNKLWDKTFGGPDDDSGSSIRGTIDGGYIITGGANAPIAGEHHPPDRPFTGDAWLIKIDSKGMVEWNRTFNFGESGYNYGTSVQETKDGGYITAGHGFGTGIGAWLIKADSMGIKQWDITLGELGNKDIRSVQETGIGEYILTGSFGRYDASRDVWLVKVNEH